MQVVVILIGASLVIAVGFLIAFIRASKRGQFKDMHTPAIRMLFDDTLSISDNEKNSK